MSCRFQPNYRGDADYRGQAGLLTEPCLDFTFDILVGDYVPDPVKPKLLTRDRFIDIDCNETVTNVSLSETSNHALYRTTDLTANHGFLARFFNAHVDDPGDYCVSVDNVDGFDPYITVHRSGALQWQGVPDSNGCFIFTVNSGQTGPVTIEVSTLTKNQKGSCDVTMNCPGEFSIDGNAPVGNVGLPYTFDGSNNFLDNSTPLGSREFGYSESDFADPVVWEISTGALPPGLSLNSATGVISGTPTTAGSYSYTVRYKKNGLVKATLNDSIDVVVVNAITNISDFNTWVETFDFGAGLPVSVSCDGLLYPVGIAAATEVNWLFNGKGFSDYVGFHFFSNTGSTPRILGFELLNENLGGGLYSGHYTKTDSSPGIAGTYNLTNWPHGLPNPPASLTVT